MLTAAAAATTTTSNTTAFCFCFTGVFFSVDHSKLGQVPEGILNKLVGV